MLLVYDRCRSAKQLPITLPFVRFISDIFYFFYFSLDVKLYQWVTTSR